jgi:hypothetical protein
MRSTFKDKVVFRRKGIEKELLNSREFNFFGQVLRERVRFNPGDDLIQFSMIKGYNKFNYYIFLDKNADLILETKGKLDNVYFLRN